MRSLVVLGLVLSCMATAASAQQARSAFVLSVDRQGSFSVAGTGVDESSVVEQARAALSRDVNTALVVEGDEGAPFESVKRAAALLQQAGATRISFRTREADQQ